ncbi:MAG: hypothetical protein ABSA59_23740 [Terriglobia bacterium]
MSRLRRLVVSDRWFFITCRVLPRRRILSGHAIIYPPYPLTISTVMESIKGGATKRINRSRREVGLLMQPRFFDRALRTVKEYNEKVWYIHHLNPVKAGLVSRPEDWPWSSVHDYTGTINQAPITPSGLPVDRVSLPADQHTRI